MKSDVNLLEEPVGTQRIQEVMESGKFSHKDQVSHYAFNS